MLVHPHVRVTKVDLLSTCVGQRFTCFLPSCLFTHLCVCVHAYMSCSPTCACVYMHTYMLVHQPVRVCILACAGLAFSDAQVLGGRLRRLRLAECLAGISLTEVPVTKDVSKGYVRRYTATLKFFG